MLSDGHPGARMADQGESTPLRLDKIMDWLKLLVMMSILLEFVSQDITEIKHITSTHQANLQSLASRLWGSC